VQLALFGAGNSGFGIVFEYLEGVIERMRVTPASRLALLVGRVGTAVVTLVVQAVILLIIAIPFGFAPDWAGVAVLLLLVAILGSALAAASNALGLVLKDVGALASVVNGVMLPLLLLSGILLPMSLAPTWLYNISRLNPLTYVVNASRDLVVGDYLTSATIAGFAVAILLAIAAFWWGARTFKTQNA
jgi:ABC-2 type transport system permease protein